MSRRKLTGKPGAAVEPETVAVRVQIVFAHQGQPIMGVANDVQMPLPSGADNMSVIGIQLEASEVIGKLSQALATPRRAGGGILVPGAPKRLPTEILTAGSPAQHRRLD